MCVKSERPRWPGSCVWRKITSRSGPYSARQARIRRSRVRRTPGSSFGCRCISASNTPTERMPGLFSRIGTTSVSKISARAHLGLEDIGQRVRSAPAPWCRLPRKEGRILGEPISRGAAEARLRGRDVDCVGLLQGHEKPLLAIGDVATGHPCALLRLGKAQVLPDRPPTPGGPGRNLRKAAA